MRPTAMMMMMSAGGLRGGLRLLGAPGWNLERGPISNEEEGGKRIYVGLGHLNGGAPGFSPVSTTPPPLNPLLGGIH